MSVQVNPYVSVDCVILGFDGEQLNVLVVRQCGSEEKDNTGNYKLPGSLIYMDENLDDAAKRVLRQLTGLTQVNMIQFRAFGGPERLNNPADSIWLEHFHNLDHHIERIVTIAYISLVRINRKMQKFEEGFEAQWVPVSQIPSLAFDHNLIVSEAVGAVKDSMRLNPTLIFELLPKKFTASQLRVVMETVLDKKLDIKNFHKKLAQMPYVVPLDEKEDGVSHRAARYYKYSKRRQAIQTR